MFADGEKIFIISSPVLGVGDETCVLAVSCFETVAGVVKTSAALSIKYINAPPIAKNISRKRFSFTHTNVYADVGVFQCPFMFHLLPARADENASQDFGGGLGLGGGCWA